MASLVGASGLAPTITKGGRHNGQNQYTTTIGNRWFSIFATTDSKSRINFLKLLQGGKEEYVINEDTLDYLSGLKVSSYFPGYVSLYQGRKFTTLAKWEQFLKERNITQATEERLLTEAALYASIIENGLPKNLGVHSDDAGQFDVFVHSLCWIHEERHYRKLIMVTDESRADSETAAHAAKIVLKVSGGTRSKVGQVVRDTFLSLKQTCRKLGVNFLDYLEDRMRQKYEIPRLATIIAAKKLAFMKGLDRPISVLSDFILQPNRWPLAG